nr:MAG TPA: hypothetical protein [Caudoviricetes sp.]DAT69702.1 MAG TPA: hypothetical protein [Caudoviricetes sp.]
MIAILWWPNQLLGYSKKYQYWTIRNQNSLYIPTLIILLT